MAPGHRLCALLVFSLTACSHFEPALCFAHCGHQPQVLDSRVGEITSSAYHSWSYRFGSTYDCWVIKGSEEEPITLSFSQFSVRCKKEWVSIKSSAGGEPVVLCGSKLPPPLEFQGGNISVVHHFLPHLFPVSSFLLSYARDSGDCPEPSFECRDGRCLPASWRCNGQVECLGSDSGYGADELGCEDEQRDAVEAKTIPYPDANAERDPDRRRATEKVQNSVRSTEGYSYADLWSPQRQLDLGGAGPGPGGAGPGPRGRGLDLGGRSQDPVGQDQPHTEKDPAITPTPIEWPCGGLLQTFYGTFSPPTSRGLGLFCVWTLDPQDSRPLRLDLQQLVLGPGDRLTVYNRGDGKGEIIKNISARSNYKSVAVESRTGLLSLAFERPPGSPGGGFRATFHVGGYCPPWEGRCGGAGGGGGRGGRGGGCFTPEQRCDGRWDCPGTGADEEGCRGCSPGQFACGAAGQRAAGAAGGHYSGRPVCYPATERCNYQLYCADGSDERDCTVCQPGTFHCDSDRCEEVGHHPDPRLIFSSPPQNVSCMKNASKEEEEEEEEEGKNTP
ncbi:LOW QUALITY PROTEIN: low-density lipoprotein receptor-related protein 10 [Menidia menidia]